VTTPNLPPYIPPPAIVEVAQSEDVARALAAAEERRRQIEQATIQNNQPTTGQQ
jgi:hypothetical protein